MSAKVDALALKNRMELFGPEVGEYIFRLESKVSALESTLARERELRAKLEEALHKVEDLAMCERESRKQAEAALRDVKSLVDSQIAYLQALAKNNDLSDHGTGKLAAFMNMRDALAIPQEPAEPERGK